jgi:hypothetical protein
MSLLIHLARYEVIERTEASKEVIGMTACGMPINKETVASSQKNHVNCASCMFNFIALDE